MRMVGSTKAFIGRCGRGVPARRDWSVPARRDRFCLPGGWIFNPRLSWSEPRLVEFFASGIVGHVVHDPKRSRRAGAAPAYRQAGSKGCRVFRNCFSSRQSAISGTPCRQTRTGREAGRQRQSELCLPAPYYFLLPTPYSLLPTSYFLSTTSYFLLPTPYFLLPAPVRTGAGSGRRFRTAGGCPVCGACA